MDQADNIIEVRADESMASVLQRLGQLAPGSRVELRMPNNARAMSDVDDFKSLHDAMQRNNLQLVIDSPESTIRGLSQLYDIPVKNPVMQRPPQMVVPDLPEEDPDALPQWNFGGSPAVTDTAPPAASAATPDLPTDPMPPQASAPLADPAEDSWADLPPDATLAADNYDDFGAVGYSTIPDEPEPAPVAPPPPTTNRPSWFSDATQPDAAPVVTEQEAANPPPDVVVTMPDTPTGDLSATAGEPISRGERQPRRSAPRGGGILDFLGNIIPPRRAPRSAPAPAPIPVVAPDLSFQATTAGPLTVPSVSIAAVTPSDNAPLVAVPPPSRLMLPDALTRQRSATRTRTITQTQSRSLLLPLVLLALILLLGAGLLYAIYNIVPTWTTADVRISLRDSDQVGPIVVSVPVQLGGSSGTTMNITPSGSTASQPPSGGILNTGPQTAAPVSAQLIQREISVSGTRPTTGGREVPNNPARGTIELTNQSSEAFTIPAGSALGTVNGKGFVTAAPATIPGTDFVNHIFGVVRVDFVATEPGPASNGMSLSGSYGNAIYYTVQQSAGGDTRTIKQVSDADAQQLLSDLRARIAAETEQDVMAAVPTDMRVVGGTITTPEDSWKIEYDHAVGDDADQLTLKLTAVPQVYAYKQADIEAAINGSLMGGIVTQGMPLDTSVAPSSVTHGEITMSGPAPDGSIVYTTSATVQVVYRAPAGLADTVKQLVVGETPTDARYSIIKSQFGAYVENIDITMQHPLGWQQDTLPTDPGRIDVTLLGAPK